MNPLHRPLDMAPGLFAILVALLVVIGALAFPSTAWADSAGPTDYRTEIVSLLPDPGDVATFTIEGGDAFVRARVAPGHTLVVYGYDGEEYIKIDADGTVYENRASESYYYNLERYGGDVPASADSASLPDWVAVDDDGEHAWHDHRAHWMSTTPLVGMKPGDSFPPDVIDVVIDDTPTTITVVTTLQARASVLWLAAGLALGAIGAALAVSSRRATTTVAITVSLAAIVAGAAQTAAVPASTGTPLYWWALPVAALATALIGWRLSTDPGLAAVVWAGVGIELVVWGWPRLNGLLDAYRPTVLPITADRVLSVAIVVTAFGLIGAAARSALGPIRARRAAR